MGSPQSMTVPGRYDQIGPVCHFVAAAAEKAGMDDDGIFHMQLACDEACTNVIEHAYGAEGVGDIIVTWRVDSNLFTVTIQDHGRPFDPNDVPPPNVPLQGDDLENMKIGGLGIHFMKKLMDEIRFHFDPNGGNTLTMVKRLPNEGAR
jgi:serine/threonine-protein kinase RsbW